MAAPRPEVSILIVSYNTRALTLAAIDSVVRKTRIAHEIIVVDNASSDGSREAVATHPAAPRLLALDDNIGFGRANNLAARHAQADLLLLLNPDTVVLEHAIDALHGFSLQHPEAMIWGGRTLFANGELNPSSCWQRMTLWNTFCRTSGLAAMFPQSPVFNGEAIGGWRRNFVREVDIVSGCFLMIGKSLWQKLGGFDPVFYMYGEEADLCLRARAMGARPMITPDATIVHLGGASEATRAAKMVKLLAAKMTLINRHLPKWQRPLARQLLKLWPLSRRVALAAAAIVRHSSGVEKSRSAWREIWQRRGEWQSGYQEAADAMPSASIHEVARSN